jgi:hypothetical protein
MTRGLLKLDPDATGTEDLEQAFDLAYYQSLSTEQRFRMSIERSILLRRLAGANEPDRDSPPLTKRR